MGQEARGGLEKQLLPGLPIVEAQAGIRNNGKIERAFKVSGFKDLLTSFVELPGGMKLDAGELQVKQEGTSLVLNGKIKAMGNGVEFKGYRINVEEGKLRSDGKGFKFFGVGWMALGGVKAEVDVGLKNPQVFIDGKLREALGINDVAVR